MKGLFSKSSRSNGVSPSSRLDGHYPSLVRDTTGVLRSLPLPRGTVLIMTLTDPLPRTGFVHLSALRGSRQERLPDATAIPAGKEAEGHGSNTW